MSLIEYYLCRKIGDPKMTLTYKIKHLPILAIETATGKARDLLGTAKRQLGFVPNMYGGWPMSRRCLKVMRRATRCFVPNAASRPRRNGCEYCMAAHSFVADKMSKVPPEITNAIRDGRPIADVKIQALAIFTIFTKIMFDKRGRPSEADVQAFLAAGYIEKNILGIILAIGVKTFSNYANHVFHTPVDGPPRACGVPHDGTTADGYAVNRAVPRGPLARRLMTTILREKETF
jgi:hypothetical protein